MLSLDNFLMLDRVLMIAHIYFIIDARDHKRMLSLFFLFFSNCQLGVETGPFRSKVSNGIVLQNDLNYCYLLLLQQNKSVRVYVSSFAIAYTVYVPFWGDGENYSIRLFLCDTDFCFRNT